MEQESAALHQQTPKVGGQATLFGAVMVSGVMAALSAEEARVLALTHCEFLVQAFTDHAMSRLQICTIALVALQETNGFVETWQWCGPAHGSGRIDGSQVNRP